MSLKEIASRADQESDAQWGSLTVGKLGQVKMKKSAVETPAPKDQEEFRQKLKLLGHHFVFLRMLHPTRKELEGVNPFTFSTYTDYMLSKRVARLQAEDEKGQVYHTPTLRQVLTYDYYVRKKAMELLEASKPLGEALKEAYEDATIKERHFTTPLSVSAVAQGATARSRSPPPSGGASSSAKGAKGKKGKKSKGKGKGFHSVTPEGRQNLLRVQFAVGTLWRLLWAVTRLPGLFWVTPSPHAHGRAQEADSGRGQGRCRAYCGRLTAGWEAGRPLLVFRTAS